MIEYPTVTLISFGFLQFNLPLDVDKVIDIRNRVDYLPSPANGAVSACGLDVDVQETLRSTAGVTAVVQEIIQTAGSLCASQRNRVAIGSSDGKYRAPAICELVAQQLRSSGYVVQVEHLHLDRPTLLASRQKCTPGWRLDLPAGGQPYVAVPLPADSLSGAGPARIMAHLLHLFDTLPAYHSAQIHLFSPATNNHALPTVRPILVFRHSPRTVHIVGKSDNATALRQAIECCRDKKSWRVHKYVDRKYFLPTIELILGKRVANLLQGAGFRTLDEALETPDQCLLQLPGFGPATLAILSKVGAMNKVDTGSWASSETTFAK